MGVMAMAFIDALSLPLPGTSSCFIIIIFFLFISSVPCRLRSLAVQRGGSGFGGAASSTHALVRGTGVFTNLSHFCSCVSLEWASVMVQLGIMRKGRKITI